MGRECANSFIVIEGNRVARRNTDQTGSGALVANVHERSLDCPLYYQSFYDSIEDEAAEILGKCNVISIPSTD